MNHHKVLTMTFSSTLAYLTGCDLKDLAKSQGQTSLGQKQIPPPASPGEKPNLSGQDPALQMSDSQIVAMFSNSGCNSLQPDLPVSDSTSSTPTPAPATLPDYYRAGLHAMITVPPTGFVGTDWYSLDRFAAQDAVKLDENLYFSQLNVPTRAFDKGFPLFSGDFATDKAGQKLIEFFRMDVDGYVSLPSDQAATDMEFAMLADDGARLSFNESATPYLNSPEVHPTKMICGSGAVHLEKNEPLSMHVSYFQGPRYHIALMLLWRKAGSSPDPLCGQAGNDYWFDSTKTPSEPTANYHSLEQRGWSVVPPASFKLPDADPFNPCLSPRVQSVFANLKN